MKPTSSTRSDVRQARSRKILIGSAVFWVLGQLASGQAVVRPVAKLIDRTPANNRTDYVLAADDEITIRSMQVKEISDKPFRIEQSGEVNFPMLGRISLAGTTAQDAETIIRASLEKFYVNPDIAVDVTVKHTEPASVIGAVGTPGVQQIRGDITLLNLLALAGGVRGDAGPVVRITRQHTNGVIPHPSAHDAGPDTSVAEINLRNLLDVRDPTDNIVIKPHDVVSIPAAEIVYVVGNVKHAGGFPLGGKTDISVLQALALAEGMDARAAPNRAQILRRGAGGEGERKIPVDVKMIMSGKAEDVPLRPNDILFIPNSAAKTITARSIEAALQLAIGMAMWRL